MAVPKHMRIVFRGVILNTPEIWSISLKYKSDFGGVEDPGLDDISASGMLTACQTFFGNARFTSSLQLQEWRAYLIGTDGTMEGNPRLELLETADFVEGTAGLWHVPQVAVVVTSVAANRGPARYGRFYLPQVAYGPDPADHRLSLVNATSLAEAASTFCKNVSATIDLPTNPANSPLVNISSIGSGTQQEVDHLQVGRVFDTQRRRRNAMLEEPYSTGHIDW